LEKQKLSRSDTRPIISALYQKLKRLISHGKFRGAYATREQAIASVRPGKLVGYDNDAVVNISLDEMSKIALLDYPVLYWLKCINPTCILDAGGHVGTKFRAFRTHLDLDNNIIWVVYDVPAVVRAGQAFAERDHLQRLSFIDDLSKAPNADVLLASGLLQYLDIPFSDLLKQLPTLPRHLVLNKVATRDGPTVVTLENFGCAEVPYQIRNREEFETSLLSLGYEIVDQWSIPNFSHTIPWHPELGASTSRGYYAKLRS
jgi:putative methyltransferase (TIGR04325 family)